MTRSFNGPVVLITPNVGIDGGVARHVVSSARGLQDHGAEVVVIASDQAEIGVPMTCIAGVTATGLGDEATRVLQITLDTIKPSVIHFHNVDDVVAVTAARCRAPVVVSAHGYSGCGPGTYYFRPGVECVRAHGAGCVPNMLLRGCAQTRSPRRMAEAHRAAPRRLAALRASDAAVVYSSALNSHLERNGVQRVFVVPLATDQVDASPDRGHRSVLFVGRVTPLKGLTTLLAALSQVDGRLRVCGTGWGLKAARAATASYGIQDRVKFSGWIDGDALSAAYRAARVVVVPSHWPEPFGLTGLEAMAHGRAVIASATGGIPDWLQDGRTGLLVPPGDPERLATALSDLLGDVERCTEMGREGRVIARALYSPAAHADGLRRVYASARGHWLESRM
jgi:glycosyltransferase involved in cell wall biosynthesis